MPQNFNFSAGLFGQSVIKKIVKNYRKMRDLNVKNQVKTQDSFTSDAAQNIAHDPSDYSAD